MSKLVGPAEAAKALFDEGKKIRCTLWGSGEFVVVNDGTIFNERGASLPSLSFAMDRKYEIIEDPPVMVGDTFRDYNTVYTVKYVDNLRIFSVDEFTNAGHLVRQVTRFCKDKASGFICDHERNGKPVP